MTLWEKNNLYFLGLGFRPMPPPENVESTLIWYKGTNLENYRQWTDALDKFLASMWNLLPHYSLQLKITIYQYKSVFPLIQFIKRRVRPLDVVRIFSTANTIPHHRQAKCAMLIFESSKNVHKKIITAITRVHHVYSSNWIEFMDGNQTFSIAPITYRKICQSSCVVKLLTKRIQPRWEFSDSIPYFNNLMTTKICVFFRFETSWTPFGCHVRVRIQPIRRI